MKKIIDQQGRLFGIISIIDVLVILVIAVLVIAFQTKQSLPQSSGNTGNIPISFKIKAETVQDYAATHIKVGDTVHDRDQATGGAIGTITKVELLPATAVRDLTDGTTARVPVEGRYDVVVTVEGEGLVTEEGYYAINRVYYIGVNASRNFYTKYAQFTGQITEVW